MSPDDRRSADIAEVKGDMKVILSKIEGQEVRMQRVERKIDNMAYEPAGSVHALRIEFTDNLKDYVKTDDFRPYRRALDIIAGAVVLTIIGAILALIVKGTG